MFGRNRELRGGLRRVSDVNSQIFTVIPALLLPEGAYNPVGNAQKASRTGRKTELTVMCTSCSEYPKPHYKQA